MAYWLANKREGQDTDFIQRFDPRFWSVDFPRPMMASVVTTGADSLRVDCEFHHRDALAGLIWESEDRFDHPLLAYDTNRDYTRTTLIFRWRSSGVLPLDAVNGPTLTVEGRDAGGATRSWFVRLWNYAVGAPDNAVVTLPFSSLREGWEADGAAVHPADIDRMFISSVPLNYVPGDNALLPARENGWFELSEIDCDGEHAMLVIGDAMVPSHEVGMSTAYDDSYNLTPARILRNVLHLGYRDMLIHYVGMSHYYRLFEHSSGDLYPNVNLGLCEPCEAWHADFLARCKALDLQPILSISYELFDEVCFKNWKQRAASGEYAQTGWVPPSTLLTPASPGAMTFLQEIAARFVALMVTAGLDVHFQIGEPWWWVTPSGEICIYDVKARDQQPVAADITDLTRPLSPEQLAVLDWAGDLLASSTADLRDRIVQEAGGTATVYLLVFTPTILDPDRPELRRANMPTGWAWPAFNVLQVEDYDWLTAGKEALRLAAYAEVDNRLGYPLSAQHYLSGFVLDPADASGFWRLIDGGIEEAQHRGVALTLVWALPQITRDGYVRLPAEETIVQAFDDVLYPLALGRDASVSPEFSTSIALTASGHERRNSQWSDARLHYDVGPGIRSDTELGVLLEFFRARRGPARGFRLADPYDFSSNGLSGSPTMTDQLIDIGDGDTATFQLAKLYGGTAEPQRRVITRPRVGTLTVSVAGIGNTDWQLAGGGKIVFTSAPAAGAEIRAGFLFDVPVRFAEDRLDISGATFAAGEAPSVPLIELREDI